MYKNLKLFIADDGLTDDSLLCRSYANYNGPQKADHVFQNNREYGKLQSKKEMSTMLRGKYALDLKAKIF